MGYTSTFLIFTSITFSHHSVITLITAFLSPMFNNGYWKECFYDFSRKSLTESIKSASRLYSSRKKILKFISVEIIELLTENRYFFNSNSSLINHPCFFNTHRHIKGHIPVGWQSAEGSIIFNVIHSDFLYSSAGFALLVEVDLKHLLHLDLLLSANIYFTLRYKSKFSISVIGL